ncbi:hypothetical protein K504DRAFT_490870 [Pleomassaria siparia CBS 279.74]|uniref:Uncharacterized protein n=1 Tax=Pleomassaria siparia CBS 279.74 TaxID=1314801 RepID=A0A6G1K968_9PLEO|nr:hypothetical protein K504DRAFT_490870 [Pleomassaria siparia CBS 279.74]
MDGFCGLSWFLPRQSGLASSTWTGSSWRQLGRRIITLCTNRPVEKYARPAFTRSIRFDSIRVESSSWDASQTRRVATYKFSTTGPKLSIDSPRASSLIYAGVEGRNATRGFQGCEPFLPGAANKASASCQAAAAAAAVQREEFFLGRLDYKIHDCDRVEGSRRLTYTYLIALPVVERGGWRRGQGHSLCLTKCLVFEDGVAGAEAGRRADMRVVWVPHQDVAAEYGNKQKHVLAGRVVNACARRRLAIGSS